MSLLLLSELIQSYVKKMTLCYGEQRPQIKQPSGGPVSQEHEWLDSPQRPEQFLRIRLRLPPWEPYFILERNHTIWAMDRTMDKGALIVSTTDH